MSEFISSIDTDQMEKNLELEYQQETQKHQKSNSSQNQGCCDTEGTCLFTTGLT